ncbi:hypothetical protein ASPSYDRAFT_50789 [Aspergillus sydowii CBS 593.65]|uniref:Actin binding protein n=1 Tax=Aspergillus sydowii CBS 593.65 TaxID=1036612 RepID=A0A1L9T1L7_9EURO|nr:uncharacterized protein ASPSYDRAFT_50789 [Aspergillus sydowii CBS 593.65]OJJ53285.1 hypothetical protein ASPSYDRAFT_50789 [Aspergillus sydowii CBS 593.65]
MASLNLSANGASISKSYQSVVESSISESARGSPTFAKWAIFSVSTPLVSAFQQDAGNKESILKVQDSGEGELADLIEEFSEGKIQFAFVKVTDVNTGLPKNVLIAWCGEGVPERTKGYFTSHLSTVSKFLHGYHVQVTARSDADLTVEGVMQKVGDSSGAKYNPRPEQSSTSAPKPPISSKPVFTPLRTGGISAGSTSVAPLPVRVKSSDDDGWGPDAPPLTRTNLEKVQPAYQPTRVNIQELKSGKQTDQTVNSSGINSEGEDVVKGGYQPVGKVDIAAIRRQAHEAGNLKDDRPEPVKGAYEPVGKVDIAAIRAKAQKADETVTKPKQSPVPTDRPPISTTEPDVDQSSRLTSLPKPKVSNRFGGGPAFTGTKPPLPTGSAASVAPAATVGSANRAFADQGGKTPAQLWAERKAKEHSQDSGAAITPSNGPVSAVATQNSGGDWKSSYSGKTWGPVQTTHTGKSAESTPHEATGAATAESSTHEPIQLQQGVNAIRDQLTQGAPRETSNYVDPVRSASPPVHSTEFEAARAPQAPELSAPQSQPPQSPAMDYSEGEGSPIQVAMPVARGARDENEEQYSPSAAEHTKDLERRPSDDEGQHRSVQDASIVVPTGDADSGQIRALVHYDYEKAEDNEVDLKEGEYVNEIEMVDKDWWLGLNAQGERGLFPSNYVEIVEDGHQDHTSSETQPAPNAFSPETVTGSTVAPGSRPKPTAKALYDYEAAEDNELSFPEDAEITNIEFPDDDWWLGEYRGKTGLFPANYVQLDG